METVFNHQAGSKRVYLKHVPHLGIFTLRPFSMELDLPILHDWVNKPYASYWGLENSSIEQVRNMYIDLLKTTDYQIYTGIRNGKAEFLMESYNPLYDVVGKYYDVEEGDWGMHLLVSPPTKPMKGFTWEVFTMVMDFLFANPNTQRVVVEPDVRNQKIHRLNKRAGFVYQQVIELPNKTAHLAFCTREHYQKAHNLH